MPIVVLKTKIIYNKVYKSYLVVLAHNLSWGTQAGAWVLYFCSSVADMGISILLVEIKCINDQPYVFNIETWEELEVTYGNFEDAIFVK